MKSLTLFMLLIVGLSRGAAAQWRVGLEVVNTYYRGSAVDTSGNPHARPGNAAMAALQLDRQFGNVRGAFRFAYGKPGFSVTGEGVTISDRTQGQVVEAAGTVGFRVGGIGPSGAVRLDLGPSLHLWKVGDNQQRSRLGGLAATTYEWSVSQRFTGAVRLEGMVSESWFDATDLPPEYERQVTWRYGWGVGLRYRLH